MNALLGIVFSTAVALVQPAPVDVTTCSAYVTNNAQIGESPVLNIAFTNASGRTITSVTFGVGGSEAKVTDTGTFTTGARIQHTFSSPVSHVRSDGCVVRAVTFADGGRWVAGTTEP